MNRQDIEEVVGEELARGVRVYVRGPDDLGESERYARVPTVGERVRVRKRGTQEFRVRDVTLFPIYKPGYMSEADITVEPV